MAQREGTTYLSLFIVACVFFLIMAVLFFIESSDKKAKVNELEARQLKLQGLEQDKKQLSDTIVALKKLVGGPNAVENWPGEEHYLGQMKDKAEKAINEVMTDLKEPAKSYDNLVACYGDLQGLFKKLLLARDESFAKRSAAVESEVKTKEASDQAIVELRKKHEETLASLQELQTKYEDLDNQSKAKQAELVQQMEKAQDEASEKLIAFSRQVNFKDNQIKALESRIDKLLEESNREKDFTEVEPDGKIVNLLSSSGKGWVNLGRQNHLSNGLVFRVFQYMKGGKKVPKGRVEVQKVDEDLSEVRVIEEVDSLNPIVAGDLITSPFYDPKHQPVFVFAGTEMDSKDLTKDYVVSKMKSYGASIVDKVDLNTDFLVALKNFENTPEYKAARNLNIRVIRERDLLEFIGR